MNRSFAQDNGERACEAAGNGLLIDNPVPSTDWSDRTTDTAIDCSTTAPGITAQTIWWNRDADAAERGDAPVADDALAAETPLGWRRTT